MRRLGWVRSDMLGLGGIKTGAVLDALRDFLIHFDRLDIAVSYVQRSGWELLKPLLDGKYKRVRLLCTDQLGISDPVAIREIQDAGVEVRAYNGKVVFHPKLYLTSHELGKPEAWLMGSANLSRSALMTAVETTVSGVDETGEIRLWFEHIFHQSEFFDEDRLANLEKAIAARIKSSLAFEKAAPSPKREEIDASAADTVELAFASLESPVVPLNADKAGNNVRTLRRIKEVLDDKRQLEGKALNEFKLLGLAINGNYSALGRSLIGRTIEEIAQGWVNWLKAASIDEIEEANPSGRLARAKSAFDTFWKFPPEITEFFLANATKPAAGLRPLLQTIELLSNTGRILPNLTLDEVLTLSGILSSVDHLPKTARAVVEDYLTNKGPRGWKEPDRVLILNAWHTER